MPAGRPSKLTPELQQEICNFLAAGNFVETVCDFVGLDIATIYDWRVCDGELPMVKLLEAIAYAEALQVVTEAAQQGDKDAAAWLNGEGRIHITENHRSVFVLHTNQFDRHSTAAKQWTKAVYRRDNYICRECGKKGGKLNAHHIKGWAEFPSLRFDLENGITLCQSCHAAKHPEVGWMRRRNN